jgi:hypothetical protein
MKIKLLSVFSTCSLILLFGFNGGVNHNSSAHKHTAVAHAAGLPSYPDIVATNFFKRSTGWIASDGGLTVPLRDGRTLWLMGDSHVNDYDVKTATVPCLFQVRNCALLQPANDWAWQHTQTLIGNGPGNKNYFKFNTNDKYFTWPGAGVQIGDTVYVYCSSLMNKAGGGAFGFGSAGNDYWAKIKYPEMTVAGYTQFPAFAGINYGFSMIKNDADGFVYVYGSKLKVIKGEIYVARFPISDPNAKWTFWDGKGWNADAAQSKMIATSPSTSVSFCKVKNKYIMVSSEFNVGCDQGKDIYTATSNSPLGPFSTPKVVYSIPDRKEGHSPFFYSVFGHPEFINSQNELLITYSINGYEKCVVDCVNGRSDPNVYRPRAIRVPLKFIDAAL